jgi:hypothetical protein
MYKSCLAFYSDIIIGVPSLQAQNLDAKIREERCRHLVAELVCRVSMSIVIPLFHHIHAQ